jgi:glycosyltransferase involved in cell wall biosynthesis
MRILHIADGYPPILGGLELQVQLLAHELARRGHEVEVATLAGPEGSRTELDGEIPVHRVAGFSRLLGPLYADPRRPFHPTLPDPGVVRALASLIRDRRPDVVHAHSWIVFSALPLLPSRQTKLVVTLHDYGLVCPKKTLVHRGSLCTGPKFFKCVTCASDQYGSLRAFALTTGLRAMRPWRGRVDRYVANSRATALACASLVRPGGAPIEVIPPFLPDAVFDSVQPARPVFVPAAGDYLMFAGALGQHKGLDVLLEAWAGLDPAIQLVVAGIPQTNMASHFPDGVIVAENASWADIQRAWAHCTVAVVPSRWPEPFGMAALEAMAAGRPVIASAVGGLAELVVDGTTGTLVPPGDVKALRAGIRQLLAHPEQRAIMGQAARNRASGFIAEVVVPKWERVYEEVTAGRHY